MGKEKRCMLTAAQIGNIGEVYTTRWLQGHGYACHQNTQLPGSTDIEATGALNKLLVQVKTAVYPNSPVSLTAEQKKAIVTRANRLGRQAWLAQLQINSQGGLVGDIAWAKLN
jgi:hypothetical protein